MRIKSGLVIAALFFLFASCRKIDEPIRFSVLGDSFSTFKGAVDPESNDVWNWYSDIGVTYPQQLWWYKVAVNMQWVLEKNNSFAGSMICNLNVGNYYGPYSFLHRMSCLGDPDVIFVFGGTNDLWNDVPFGDFVYADWTAGQLCEIRPALACLFSSLKQGYPRAELYFLVDMDAGGGICDEDTKKVFVESVHQIASHYQVRCIDLMDVHKDWWHPNEEGQDDIARQVTAVLQVDFNVENGI